MNQRTLLSAAVVLGLLCNWGFAAPGATAAPQQSPQPAAAPIAAAGAGLDAITPFINANTDLVVAVDLGTVNPDQVRTWMQNQMQKAGVDKATMDKMQAESKEEMDKAVKWLSDFKQAGGRRIYMAGSMQDMMTGGPLVVVPMEGSANGEALTNVFQLDKEQGEDKPVSATVGRNLLIGKKEAVDGAKAAQPAARPELMQALGATATVKIALSASNLNKAGNVGGMPLPPQAQGIEWISINMNAPPAVGASVTIQAKDAATAKQVADQFNQMLAMMQQQPQVQQALGNNAAALTKALTPTTNNRRVTIALDTKTIEGTLMPVAIKAAMAEWSKKQNTPPAVEGAEPAQPGL